MVARRPDRAVRRVSQGGLVYWTLPIFPADLVRTLRPEPTTSSPTDVPPLVSRANSYRQALSINHLSYLVSPAMQKRPALALIGAGEVRISVSAHRSIKRWRLLLPLLCIIGTVLGVAYILGPVLRPDSFPELLDKVEAIVQGACFVVLPWIGLGGWAFSMIIATKL